MIQYPDKIIYTNLTPAELDKTLKIPSRIYNAFFAKITKEKYERLRFNTQEDYYQVTKSDNGLVILVRRPDILFVHDFIMRGIEDIDSFLRNMKTGFREEDLKLLRKKPITAYVSPDNKMYTVGIGVENSG